MRHSSCLVHIGSDMGGTKTAQMRSLSLGINQRYVKTSVRGKRSIWYGHTRARGDDLSGFRRYHAAGGQVTRTRPAMHSSRLSGRPQRLNPPPHEAPRPTRCPRAAPGRSHPPQGHSRSVLRQHTPRDSISESRCVHLRSGGRGGGERGIGAASVMRGVRAQAAARLQAAAGCTARFQKRDVQMWRDGLGGALPARCDQLVRGHLDELGELGLDRRSGRARREQLRGARRHQLGRQLGAAAGRHICLLTRVRAKSGWVRSKNGHGFD